ncbi:MAG: late competence development ComFB family protein [Erysipelotrichales bacterium]|nr:late competence development ComFB family protein [Erysipelotrichales bacterium]
MQFYNMTEIFVRERLDEIIEKEGGCNCVKCYIDILALACNHLPPRYVNTEEGELYKRIEVYRRQQKMDVDVEIYKAIKVVRAHPRHKLNPEEGK